MATTSPDNIFFPVGTDDVGNLKGVFAQVAASVQNALTRRAIQAFKWPNTVARTSQTGMTAGDLGYQIDSKDYYSYDGSRWNLSGSSVRETGVVSNGTRTVSSSSVGREGIDCRLYVLFNSGTALSAGSVVGRVPSWAVPSTRAMLNGFGGSSTFSGWVETNGDIMVYGPVAGFTAGMYLGGTYMIR